MPPRPNLKQPLAEVFGYPINNFSAEAVRCRENKLCPFNNKSANCTKDKARNPLGVCSVFHGTNVVCTCPVRFREDWLIATDAAAFFFPEKTQWTTLTEIRLQDAGGGSAGNIDAVLVSYDESGRICDFGALEVQAVYISGNVRIPFEFYMRNPRTNAAMDWSDKDNYPNPDFLSSSRKRLAPQLIYKGGIFNAWGKKTAVALDKHFYRTLPRLRRVSKDDAELAWLVYEIIPTGMSYKLSPVDIIYTRFTDALNKITRSKAGRIQDFIEKLQEKLDEKLDNPPTTEDLQFKVTR